MKRENRKLRDLKFTKLLEQKMELILQYVWAPIAAWLVALSKLLQGHGKDLAIIKTSQDSLSEAVAEARTSRKEIVDKIETVRTELTTQHETLRKEQREDFKEIRDLIVNGANK